MKEVHKKSQSGRFVLEMIVVLALLALFAPMIYQSQQEKREQEVYTTNAQQIQQIVKGIYVYLQKNSRFLIDKAGATVGDTTFNALTSSGDVTEIKLTDSELKKYLPPGLSDASVSRLFSKYVVGVKRTLVDSDVKVSAMVVAIPKTGTDVSISQGISNILGASGGSVGLNENQADLIVGNNGTWEVSIDEFFSDSKAEIIVGSIGANIDYYTPAQLVDIPETVDSGFLHRSKSTPTSDGTDGTTMQVDLEMGEGAEDTDARHSFENVEGVYRTSYKPEDGIPCANGDPGCISQKFDEANYKGKTALGRTCTQKDECISIDGPPKTEAYVIRPSGTTLLEDIRIGALGGSKLSEVIPPMILMEIHRGKINGSSIQATRYCPTGYVPTTTVVPVNIPQYSFSSSNEPWIFLAVNFKNNTGTPGSLWGTGYSCANMVFNNNNILAHYLDGNKVKLWSHRVDETPIGGEGSAPFSISTTTDTNIPDPITSTMPTNACTRGSTSGKILFNFGINSNRCGISNLSTVFACNEELLTAAKTDFNIGPGQDGTDLLRWEFYHPPVTYANNLNIAATTEPNSQPASVTLLNNSKENVMQTRNWILKAENDIVTYDVYIYCKYVPQAFINN